MGKGGVGVGGWVGSCGIKFKIRPVDSTFTNLTLFFIF